MALHEPKSARDPTCSAGVALEFWRVNQGTFPLLSYVARVVLSIPGTSVPSERLFSAAGEILTKPRNRLGSDLMRALLCLDSMMSQPVDAVKLYSDEVIQDTLVLEDEPITL